MLSHMVQAVDGEGTKRHHKISCMTVGKMHQLKDLTGEGAESQWRALIGNYTHTHMTALRRAVMRAILT